MYVFEVSSDKFILILFALSYCESLSFLPGNEQNVTLQVSTTNGIVQGKEKRTEKNIRYFSYEGIPYAQPPLNNLRFRGPRPAKKWKGVLNTTKIAQGCMETKLRYFKIEMGGVEDCLYLNVYTPQNMQLNEDGLLPVTVWIYGGAFVEGDTTPYGPDHLLDKSLVVVHFNYRLGAFGFLSTLDDSCPGNYGLKDQNAALQWIHKNVHKFGGDPTKITISGHSAGGASVLYHMLSMKSRGLFSRAVAWSGDVTASWSNQKKPKIVAMQLSTILGLQFANTTEMIQKLRKIDAEDILSAQMLIIFLHLDFQNGGVFAPTVESEGSAEGFITELPYDMLKRGDFAKVPLMIGMASKEVGLFAKLFDLVRPFLSLLDMSPSIIPNGIMGITSSLSKEEIIEKIKEKYFLSNSFAGATNDEIINAGTDLLYTIPITRTIKLMSPYVPTYFFVSSHSEKSIKLVFETLHFPVDTATKGTIHGEDLALIWDYQHKKAPIGIIELQKKFLELWKNFAYTGNPTPILNLKLGTVWPAVTETKNISYLSIEDDMKIRYNYKKDVIDFWDALSDKNIEE